jgi:pimeloyl-ACP methyl ester carboxylesterase
MPLLQRPDGVTLPWEARGDGPLVVVAHQFFSPASVFEGLMADLARDHRIVTYDVRGTGEATRQGPYDLDTDAEDLAALIDEAGGRAVVLAMADGCNRTVRLGAEHPELVEAIVSPAGNPVGRRAVAGTDGLAASESVLAALVEMVKTDYRGALRTMFSTSNPGQSEETTRDRVSETVEYCPQEAALPRMMDWIEDDPADLSRSFGDRLWVLEHGTNPWFPIAVARRAREILPEANILEVEDGPITRPDIAAGIVRGITAGTAAGVLAESHEQPG